MKTLDNLTAEYLRSILHYDPVTGIFTWKIALGDRVRVGYIAGSLQRDSGYILIRINKTGYRAHRLAFLYMYGRWPKGDIDHIDGDRSNNRSVNLREAKRSQNQANRCIEARNKSGFKGVSFMKHNKSKPWRASIEVNGRAKNLGHFDSPEAAHAAYRKAADHHFGAFANYG